MKDLTFTFSDTIAGYVVAFDHDDEFTLRTSDGREFRVALTSTTGAQLVRNLGEPYADATGQLKDMLVPGKFLYAYGIFYPHVDGYRYEAKMVTFLGRAGDEYVFEKPDWWINQIRALADFYLRAQWPDGVIDYRRYRTKIDLSGVLTGDARQETDTISRLVYGFATAFLLTGDDRYLEAAEKGTEYLRDHMRFVDDGEGIVYWYHGIDIQEPHERKIFASEFGDDYDALAAYEQIYALAGPAQTFRATGDPRILSDMERTVTLFDKHFKDDKLGGYWSHVDPVTMDGRSDSLGRNRARKNWNSVGDHAPAYLINLWLATGEQRYADMLVYCADLITEKFADYAESPFVQERFHEDWSEDETWGWQQNAAVVGHNLKIAWNLIRIQHMSAHDGYVELSNKIAELMPEKGMDIQRTGWYDVVQRVQVEGEPQHRYVWHDRKAWWQQEQGILAYYILAGSYQDETHLRLARESAAFYNAWFLDHDEGGVYFNVLANGIPYLLGTERLKGSHSMSGYHAFELAYLSVVYTNLLVTKEPLDLWFKPQPQAFPDGVLRVSPDILPPGSLRIDEVEIDGVAYDEFDAEALTVQLPERTESIKIRVRLVPSGDPFNASTAIEGDTVRLTLGGVLDQKALGALRRELDETIAAKPQRLILLAEDLTSISAAGLRAFTFAREKLGTALTITIVSANDAVAEGFREADLSETIEFVDDEPTAS